MDLESIRQLTGHRLLQSRDLIDHELGSLVVQKTGQFLVLSQEVLKGIKPLFYICKLCGDAKEGMDE